MRTDWKVGEIMVTQSITTMNQYYGIPSAFEKTLGNVPLKLVQEHQRLAAAPRHRDVILYHNDCPAPRTRKNIIEQLTETYAAATDTALHQKNPPSSRSDGRSSPR